MDRILTIIDKEWSEVFKNRMVLFLIIFLPLFFTILPLVILYFMAQSGGAGGSTDMPAQFALMCGTNLSGMDCAQIFITNEFLLFYMLMPIIIPITIAAYSIVGEKTTRSLEPLLATPISTEELLTGKALAAAIPAVGATWLAFLIFIACLPIVGVSPAVRQYILGPTWLLAVFLAGPLMSVMAVNFAILVSSRVSDPRAAEQISAVLIVPILALLLGQMAGFLILNVTTMLIFCLIIALIDVGMIYLGAKLFQRETILTKWK
jgi:ABC-2 type transport system permease protein